MSADCSTPFRELRPLDSRGPEARENAQEKYNRRELIGIGFPLLFLAGTISVCPDASLGQDERYRMKIEDRVRGARDRGLYDTNQGLAKVVR